MQVKRLLHNTVFASTAAGDIIFDPYLINKYRGEKPKADYIFITHGHFDHFSPEDIQAVAKCGSKIICPDNLKTECAKLCPVVDTVSGLSITRIPAYNIDKPFHKKQDGGLGYLINDGVSSLFVAGDTDCTSQVMAVKCDICALPIGGTYTMDPYQAAKAVNAIRPKAVIPTHYGDIDSVLGAEAADTFKALLPKDVQCLIFNP